MGKGDTQTFRDLVQEANAAAKARGEVLALAHVYVLVLSRVEGAGPGHAQARERIESQVLPQLSRGARGYREHDEVATFSWQDAERSYRQHLATSSSSGSLAQTVLLWLLEVGFEDVSQKWCLEACRRAGVGASSSSTAVLTLPELGFGRPFAASGLEVVEAEPLFGRDAELAKHLGFLTLALEQRTHYLLVGKQGVGKSFFLSHLLARAVRGPLGRAPNSASGARRFVLFGREDFIGSETENKERFGRLYSYLQQYPDAIPVFDELEHILRHAPKLADHFSAMFGSVIAGGGRSFVLVCESNVASGSPILKGIRSCPLPALSTSDTRRLLLERHVPRLCQENGLAVAPNTEVLVDALLNMAPARYPGRFLPELALHIANSTVNRARNRITFLKQEPLGAVAVEDLWAHIVDEQGLNPEVFGKDPKEFYRNLRTRLAQKIIGQDHAVAQISTVLEMQAQRPAQRAPRGRFLFVGPPGVGKTELARSLAQELGFGEEAFFVFNMSEYSSETARTRFMGADPGYVGFSNTRTIYQCVRERPACVVLLDEIDRADATIQDILLSIMEGEGKDAEGQSVYFAQAVFIMTTNLGQDAVQTAYADVLSGKLTREELVRRFSDEQLRRLVLEGASDDTEVAMQARVDQLVAEAKALFRTATADAPPVVTTAGGATPAAGTTPPAASRSLGQQHDARDLQAIDRYASLKELRARLDRQVRTSPLDRALLDRIDFILPFFPIKERSLLERILELKLKAFGWLDCPAETQAIILNQAMAQKESVRPLERLIKKYLCVEA